MGKGTLAAGFAKSGELGEMHAKLNWRAFWLNVGLGVALYGAIWAEVYATFDDMLSPYLSVGILGTAAAAAVGFYVLYAAFTDVISRATCLRLFWAIMCVTVFSFALVASGMYNWLGSGPKRADVFTSAAAVIGSAAYVGVVAPWGKAVLALAPTRSPVDLAGFRTHANPELGGNWNRYNELALAEDRDKRGNPFPESPADLRTYQRIEDNLEAAFRSWGLWPTGDDAGRPVAALVDEEFRERRKISHQLNRYRGYIRRMIAADE